jgi:DNA-binding response OmpR family regulator
MRILETAKSWLRRPTIQDLQISLSSAELRKRVKIVVVDDEEDSFPTRALQADGYTVGWWKRLDNQGLRRLEDGDFDIIILDIQDVVAASLSDTGDSLGVLRRLKSVNPGQVVVAFSGKAYDLSSVPFWRLADDALRKPVTHIQCKELLDRLIERHVSVLGYWQNIQRLLGKDGVSQNRSERLEKYLTKSATSGRQATFEEIRDIVGTIESVATVFG